MTGIAGLLEFAAGRHVFDGALPAMLDRMSHRGTCRSEWHSADGVCRLGVRSATPSRSEAVDAMVVDASGRYAVVADCLLFNRAALRDELQRCDARVADSGDANLLLQGFLAWGGPGLARRLQGHFVFVIYDAFNRTIFLARDHAGTKPLYWWRDDSTFVFASELKAVLAYPRVRREVEPGTASQFLLLRYVPGPSTMVAGVRRLQAASYLEVGAVDARITGGRYWKYVLAPEPVERATEQLDLLESRLERAIGSAIEGADQVAAQLSGGIDSSLIVALTRRLGDKYARKPLLRTFSVDFDVPGFSETSYARAIAERYQTEHHAVRVDTASALRDLPHVAWVHDEPIGEPIAVPTFRMCRAAAHGSRLMLTGEGADEQFGGYLKYGLEAWIRYLDVLPGALRSTVGRALLPRLPFAARRERGLLSALATGSQPLRLACWYGALDPGTHRSLTRRGCCDDDGQRGVADLFERLMRRAHSSVAVDTFLYCDLHTRLVDNVLVNAERMSAGAGVDICSPFLSPEVLELSAALAPSLKVSGLHTKVLLKRLAERHLPIEIVRRRKVGFAVPVSAWLTANWRLVRYLLLSRTGLSRGLFCADAVRTIVDQYERRQVDWSLAIWTLLTLEIWNRIFLDAKEPLHAAKDLAGMIDARIVESSPGSGVVAAPIG